MKYFFTTIVGTLLILNSHWTYAASHSPLGILITKSEINGARSNPLDPRYTALVGKCSASLTAQPLAPASFLLPPSNYSQPNPLGQKMQQAMTNDAALTLDEALCWQLTHDRRYADHAIAILGAWLRTRYPMAGDELTQGNSRLLVNYCFPPMVLAADLLRDSPGWDDDKELNFRQFLTARMLPLSYAYAHALAEANNFDASGNYFESAIRAFLGDYNGLKNLNQRWQAAVAKSFNENSGETPDLCRNSAGPIKGGLPQPWCAGLTQGQNGLYYQTIMMNGYAFAAEVQANVGLSTWNTGMGAKYSSVYCKTAQWIVDPIQEPYYQQLYSHGLKFETPALNRSILIYRLRSPHSCYPVRQLANSLSNVLDPFPSVPFQGLFFR